MLKNTPFGFVLATFAIMLLGWLSGCATAPQKRLPAPKWALEISIEEAKHRYPPTVRICQGRECGDKLIGYAYGPTTARYSLQHSVYHDVFVRIAPGGPKSWVAEVWAEGCEGGKAIRSEARKYLYMKSRLDGSYRTWIFQHPVTTSETPWNCHLQGSNAWTSGWFELQLNKSGKSSMIRLLESPDRGTGVYIAGVKREHGYVFDVDNHGVRYDRIRVYLDGEKRPLAFVRARSWTKEYEWYEAASHDYWSGKGSVLRFQIDSRRAVVLPPR